MLRRRVHFLVERAGRVERAVGMAQEFACHEHHIGLARAHDVVRELGCGDYADRAWHIGQTTMRLRNCTSRMASGENR